MWKKKETTHTIEYHTTNKHTKYKKGAHEGYLRLNDKKSNNTYM